MTIPAPIDAAHAAAVARVLRAEVERADMPDASRRRTLALVDLLLETIGAEPQAPADPPAPAGSNVVPFRRAQ